MTAIGLRPIFRSEEVSVLELRGGTHLVLLPDDAASPVDADFDFMVAERPLKNTRLALSLLCLW